MIIPTIVIVGMILWMTQQHLSLLDGVFYYNIITFTTGLLLASFLFHHRWRIVPITSILLVIYVIIKYFLHKLDFEDVDFFRIIHLFNILSILFFFGWIVAILLTKSKAGPFIVGLLFILFTTLNLVRDTAIFNDQFRDWSKWLKYFVPVLLYSFYIIYVSQYMINIRKNDETARRRLLSYRVIGVLILLLGLITTTILIEKTYITQELKKYKESSDGSNGTSMLQNSEDGFKLNEKSSLAGSNSRNKQLLFAAYIDNFFPDSDIPNPLYLTSFYYSRFDSVTETFIKVDDMPDKDLFEPNPSQIPLYNIVTDSSVLAFGKDNKYQKEVSIEVYNKAMANDQFCAPTTSYKIQPIAIAPEYRSQYKSAYRATSRVSQWNSAYFVYNIAHPEAIQWQEMRNNKLREAKDYTTMPQQVYEYYTHLPRSHSLDSIKALAIGLAPVDALPIEKVMAVKNFFTATDDNGKKVFSYSDNPGIPDIPSASKLNYFVFNQKKGYCAYYAGATLFMLRAMGIPSRVVVGFLTEDRSEQNRGWYYYYANQSHAWVQVYFPGFGWIDFDTTVGNDDARQSEQPDGTPPIQPSKASLVINGIVKDKDQYKKKITIKAHQIGVGSKNTQDVAQDIIIDVSTSKISIDTMIISIDSLQSGDTVTALSYDEQWSVATRTIADVKNASLSDKGLSVDQVLKRKVVEKKIGIDSYVEKNFKRFVWWPVILGLVILLTLGVFSFPYLLYRYYISRSIRDDVAKHSHYAHQATQYLAYMIKDIRDYSSTKDFAHIIDSRFGTTYDHFVNHYLKIKYYPHAYNNNDYSKVKHIPYDTMSTILHREKDKYKYLRWLHVVKAIQYLLIKKKYEAA